MKKLLFSFVLLSLSTFTFAQKFGVKAGANFASQKASFSGISISTDAATSFHIGAVVEFGAGNIAFQPGLLFSIKGGKSNSVTSSINYLEVPLNVIFKFGEGSTNFFLNAGPYLGYALSAKSGDTVQTIGSGDDDLKALDLGLNIGGGVRFGQLQAYLNYGLGLNNLSNVASDPTFGDISIKNNNFSVGLGYFF